MNIHNRSVWVPDWKGVLQTGVACLLLVAGGCSRGPATCTVSGEVTYRGEAVTSGLINFMPDRGQPLGGSIEPDGSYEFQLPPDQYRVRIDTPPAIPPGWKESDSRRQLGPRQVPPKYGRYQTSGLTLTITPQDETKVVDFELK